MKISIITVAYNSEKTIADTIESVLNQSVCPLEYIIVDGLSKDKTVEVAKSYAPSFLEKGISYKIISEKDNGIYDAMNKGIRMAEGDIIGMINSDDWYEPNAIETVLDTYSKTPFDMFYADINLIKENGTVIIKHSRIEKFPTSRHWNHPTTFITKQTYEELGSYRCEGLYDDFDMMLRVRKSSKKIIINNKILANFRVGGISTRKSLSETKRRYSYRYRAYRNNNYSRLFAIECFVTEVSKLMLS